MKNKELIAAIGVIAEPMRIQILRIIAAEGEMCAKDILPAFNITQPTLSHHMAVLEECGVVVVRREGRCVYYSLNRETFLAINEFFRGFMEKSDEPVSIEKNAKKDANKLLPLTRNTTLIEPILTSIVLPKNINIQDTKLNVTKHIVIFL